MRGTARRARGRRWPAYALCLFAAAAAGVLLLTGGAVARGPAKSGAAVLSPPFGSPAPASAAAGRSRGEMAAVGVLFTTTSAGKLGHHFCTATVVHSDHGDLAVTAAHCVTGRRGTFAFVPGYDGQEPYGTWTVTAVYTDQAWRSSRDPNDDVAFLRLSGSSGRPVEDITGAEQLGTSPSPPALAEIVAYPDKSIRPLRCVNRLSYHTPTQLKFDCRGYTNGSSGGPFLGGASAAFGTVIGVIGGDDQGGPSSSVSYSPVFGPAVTALYRNAAAAAG